MEFISQKINENTDLIAGSGEIRGGDADRLIGEILSIPRKRGRLLALNSTGGSIVAGESLASVVGRYHIPIVILPHDMCTSACFLVFAASPDKMFFPSSSIGVHSASVNQLETRDALAMTTTMARSASDLGVPPAIIGKMVTTASGGMAWLKANELITMGAKLLDEPLSPVAQAAPASSHALQPQPAPPAITSNAQGGLLPKLPSRSEPADEQSLAFQEGRASRMTWEEWFGTLAGDAKLGAEYWTSERSKRQPGNCVGTLAFKEACLEARQRLAGSDTKRKTNPQFWWGWNSL